MESQMRELTTKPIETTVVGSGTLAHKHIFSESHQVSCVECNFLFLYHTLEACLSVYLYSLFVGGVIGVEFWVVHIFSHGWAGSG